MRAQTPEEQFNRLRDQIQGMYLEAYPNPERVGCPGQRAIEYLAQWTANCEELEKQDDFQHVIRCSPCYREYLDMRREFHAGDSHNAEPMPKRVEKRIGKTLDRLEAVMKKAAREVGRR